MGKKATQTASIVIGVMKIVFIELVSIFHFSFIRFLSLGNQETRFGSSAGVIFNVKYRNSCGVRPHEKALYNELDNSYSMKARHF